MPTLETVYLVYVRNLVVGAFGGFDAAVDFVRKRYGGSPDLQQVVISSCPFNPPARPDLEDH